MKGIMEKEWETEPNYMDGKFFGLPCFIKRHEDFKTLNGYVGVPEINQYYEKDYNDLDVDVHGGLTFANGGVHKIFGYYWWFGFDCAHAFDYSPGRTELMEKAGTPAITMRSLFNDEVYRNMPYVQEQCIQLAYQLSDHAELEYANTDFRLVENNKRICNVG
jgi:hypothetical protein